LDYGFQGSIEKTKTHTISGSRDYKVPILKVVYRAALATICAGVPELQKKHLFWLVIESRTELEIK
jgi:hypothetical protein